LQSCKSDLILSSFQSQKKGNNVPKLVHFFTDNSVEKKDLFKSRGVIPPLITNNEQGKTE
jgi:hypothetical protein